jgi:hypothetical protein
MGKGLSPASARLLPLEPDSRPGRTLRRQRRGRRRPGHRTIACRAPGCDWTVYEPPHDPATAKLTER